MLWKKPQDIRPLFRTLRFQLASTFLLLLTLVLGVVGVALLQWTYAAAIQLSTAVRSASCSAHSAL